MLAGCASKQEPISLLDAAIRDDISTAQSLLDQWADIEQQDQYWYTPLLRAANWASKEMVELLLQHGANVNYVSSAGSALMMVNWIYTGVVKLLLDYGANVNLQDDQGNTALMEYAPSFNKETPIVIKMLLDHGADVHIKNRRWETALMQTNVPEIRNLLIQYWAKE